MAIRRIAAGSRMTIGATMLGADILHSMWRSIDQCGLPHTRGSAPFISDLRRGLRLGLRTLLHKIHDVSLPEAHLETS